MTPETEDILNYIQARVGRGKEVRAQHIARRFLTINIFASIRELERIGFVKTRGARGRRIELSPFGVA